jgi:flavin reductase (DIM6/NTAB) family NADH-FMN oxidoreductase RutF
MSVSPLEFRRAMGCFATGVTIVTVDLDGEVHGMTANAFASVSLDPLLILVCVDHTARTHAYLYAKKRFGINILSADQRAISEYYARVSTDSLANEHAEDQHVQDQHAQDQRTEGERAEAEAGARFDRTGQGTPILHGALAYLECRLQSTQDAGDHTIFIAEVENVVVREGEPLLFFRGRYRGIGVESPE